MLNWFKKLTNRLFGEEIEEDIKEEQFQEEYDQTEKITEHKESRPAFRFPIITDAEIYGWEDDGETEEMNESVKRPVTRETKLEFNPVPLYENERWPEEKTRVIDSPQGRLFNGGENQRVIEKKEKPLRQEEISHRNEKNQALKTDLENIQNERRAQRFTPSKVPSPIYGYTKPKVDNYESTDYSKVDEHQSIVEEKKEEKQTLLPHVENRITSQQKIEPYTQAEEEKAQQNSEVLQEELVVTDNEQESTEILPEELSSYHELVEESSVTEEEILEGQVVETTERELLSSDQQQLEENPVEDNEQQLPTEKEIEESPVEAIETLEQIEQDDEELEASTTQNHSENSEVLTQNQQAEEKLTEESKTTNDEKIVPFNVLMLKSDKRKLKARQLANEIADEMKAKQKQTREKKEQEKQAESQPVIEEVKEIEQEAGVEEVQPFAHYAFPELDYLMTPESKIEDTDWLKSQSEKLEESLSHFGVQANVVDAVQGPTVTRFELTVEQGTKVSRVRNLTDDLKLTLAARDIRIEAPIPGKSSIGIEIPNRKTRAVRISEVIQTEAFKQSESPLEAVLGLGLTGEPVTLDLRKMPHGMIAGATGSGKSVCINSILVSLLYKASPSDLQMMLIDPKMVELAPFNGIPHLISPVITDVKAATTALKWAVAEMERRYELLAHAGVRDIERYNKQVTDHRQFSLKMPYLLIVIDELADLMMMAPADVEVSISRITQKARACGIHLIIATQRPSVDVITGIIKANIPTRIAFSVSSQVDSRTMIDMNGAERLLGKGDMLYVGNGESTPIRLQGTFVTDDEIERIIEHVQREASPTYLFGQDELLKSASEEEEDPLFTAVCEFIYQQNSASTSMLQRNFSIGYNRAAKLMDRLEELSFISPQQGSKARDVYLSEADLNKLTETIL